VLPAEAIPREIGPGLSLVHVESDPIELQTINNKALARSQPKHGRPKSYLRGSAEPLRLTDVIIAPRNSMDARAPRDRSLHLGQDDAESDPVHHPRMGDTTSNPRGFKLMGCMSVTVEN
jgi:hypothetical protein